MHGRAKIKTFVFIITTFSSKRMALALAIDIAVDIGGLAYDAFESYQVRQGLVTAAAIEGDLLLKDIVKTSSPEQRVWLDTYGGQDPRRLEASWAETQRDFEAVTKLALQQLAKTPFIAEHFRTPSHRLKDLKNLTNKDHKKLPFRRNPTQSKEGLLKALRLDYHRANMPGKRKMMASYPTSGPAKKRGKAKSFIPGVTRKTGVYGRFNKGGGATAELKWYDNQVGEKLGGTFADERWGTIDHTGSDFTTFGANRRSLTTIAIGNTESTRIGRQIVVKKIHIRGVLQMDRESTGSTMLDPEVGTRRCRYIIYLDKQTNGVAATVLDILQVASINSLLNLNNSGRFRILKDKTLTFNAMESEGGSTYTPVQKTFKFDKNCNIDIHYSTDGGTSGAIAEHRSNNIGIFFIADGHSDAAAPSQGLFRANYIWRVRYTD